MITGIVAALPEEISTLTNKKIARGDCSFIADNILLAHSGAGPLNAANAANLLMARGANAIISWGCAAALDDSLQCGDLVLPMNLIAEISQPCPIDPVWRQRTANLLAARFEIRMGSLLESSNIVSSVSEKTALRQRTGAIALDMESAAIAKSAAKANVPCLVIRVIADPADMELPQAVSYAMNDSGAVEIKKLLGFLMTHPVQIPGLIKLGLHFHTAARKLKSITEQLNTLAYSNPTAAVKQ